MSQRINGEYADLSLDEEDLLTRLSPLPSCEDFSAQAPEGSALRQEPEPEEDQPINFTEAPTIGSLYTVAPPVHAAADPVDAAPAPMSALPGPSNPESDPVAAPPVLQINVQGAPGLSVQINIAGQQLFRVGPLESQVRQSHFGVGEFPLPPEHQAQNSDAQIALSLGYAAQPSASRLGTLPSKPESKVAPDEDKTASVPSKRRKKGNSKREQKTYTVDDKLPPGWALDNAPKNKDESRAPNPFLSRYEAAKNYLGQKRNRDQDTKESGEQNRKRRCMQRRG